jgi:enamine deaminase RidA (YjgF/YER057c/UK114 family)
MSDNPKTTTYGHYAASVRVGDFIFISGQVPRDSERRIVGATIEEQTVAVFRKLRDALAVQGATLADLAKIQVFLADMKEWSRFNEEYGRQIGNLQPARTCVGCALNGDVKITVDAIAYRPIPRTP